MKNNSYLKFIFVFLDIIVVASFILWYSIVHEINPFFVSAVFVFLIINFVVFVISIVGHRSYGDFADSGLYSQIIANMPEGINLVDTHNSTFVYTNSKFNEMFGYSNEELIGKHVSILNAGKGSEPNEKVAEIREVLSADGVWQGELLNTRKDGTEFWTRASISKFFHENYGEVWVTVQSDINEEKLAKKALVESEKMFRSVAEGSLNMIFINQNGKIVYANEACENVMGYSKDELLNPEFNFMDLMASSSRDEVIANFAKHQSGKAVPAFNYKLVTKDGKNLSATHTTNIIEYNGAPAILGVVTLE
ncbi:MAG: PAS domain-containing protein [Candidatus Uhrbacteria bacterium]|nr:PAS domain-containing protein [Candidatus Uhrbacteria bacterium]